MQPVGGHAFDALLALVRLMIGDPRSNRPTAAEPGQAEHDPALAHASPDAAVDIFFLSVAVGAAQNARAAKG